MTPGESLQDQERGSVTRFDAYVTENHYAAHILPVWLALPDISRGRIWCHPRIADGLRRELPAAQVAVGTPGSPPRPVIVASCSDLATVDRLGVPIALIEHGAGQTYQGHDGPCYAGGSGREAVGLFLCPSERVAGLNRARYPEAQAIAVGAPDLDRWHGGAPHPSNDRPRVAFAMHWNCHIVPETRWAWPHYEAAIRALASRQEALPYEMVGHGHPRAWRWFADRWDDMRVRKVQDFSEIAETCDLLVSDNSSVLWAFASLGRPVLLLDAPWYRPDVEHGLRFWAESDVGVRVADPARLASGILDALADTPVRARRREEISSRVYACRDGHAAERAADALCEWAASLTWEADMNPKAPQRTRVMRGAGSAASSLPERRLRRLGMNDDEFRGAVATLAGLPSDEREAAIAQMNAMTDSEIRSGIAEDREDHVAAIDVPPGSVMDVLVWAEGSPDRARAAFALESEKALPRRTLLAALHAIIEPVNA